MGAKVKVGVQPSPKLSRPGFRRADDRVGHPETGPSKARPLLSPMAPLFVFSALLARHQGDLLEGIGGRRLLGRERQLYFETLIKG